MARKKHKGSSSSASSKLDQKKKALEETDRQHGTAIERVDNGSLNQTQADYGKIANDSLPVLSLPTEVTCLIFELFIESHRLEYSGTRENSLLPEVIISHVCKQWRDASLNYPRLWTRFFFILGDVKPLHTAVDRFDTYIKRSRSQNLELSLDFRPRPARQFLPITEQYQLIRMALEQTHRWKIVTLLSDIGLLIQERFPDLITASAPNLEYFVYSPSVSYIRTRDPREPEAQFHINSVTPTLLNGGTPKLRYLLLDCSSSGVPPFANLTTLRIEAKEKSPKFIYSWKAFLEILSITCLANLSIVGSIFAHPHSESKGAVRIVTMNNLKHLRYSHNKSMTFLLPFLRAPLLETLSIRDQGWLFEDLQTSPFGLPAESYFFPSLQILILIGSASYSAYTASYIMNLTQNIKSILITYLDSRDHFLIGPQENGAFIYQRWPKLTSFMMTAGICYSEDIETVSDFVRSRPKDTLKLRLFGKAHDFWKRNYLSDYQAIQEHCTIEVLNVEEQAKTVLAQPMWPPGVDCPEYAFRNESDRFKRSVQSCYLMTRRNFRVCRSNFLYLLRMKQDNGFF